MYILVWVMLRLTLVRWYQNEIAAINLKEKCLNASFFCFRAVSEHKQCIYADQPLGFMVIKGTELTFANTRGFSYPSYPSAPGPKTRPFLLSTNLGLE